MLKLPIKIIIASLLCIIGANHDAIAARGTIKAITSAPAGTSMRIQCSPFDVTVSGAEPEGHYGMYISKGEGSEITISGEGLSQVEIYGCGLTSLETISAPDLFILKCYNNKLTTLDLSSCAKLEILECQKNNLETLDLKQNPLIEKLDVSNNNLSSLELGTLDYLTELDCSNNPLTSLEVTNCKELTDLYFQNCTLSDINLSNNPKLEWIFAYNNGLVGETMTNFIENMPEARTTGLIYIIDTRAQFESNVCTMDDVRAFATKGWATMDYLGGSGSDSQIGKFYPGCDYVPTISDSKISLTTSRQPGEKITLNISTTSNITIDGVEEKGESGKLTYTLTSSNVEIMGDVTSFECPDNDITALSFSDPSLLTYIECQNNKIESLDLTGARRLVQLYCQNNAISSLNLEGCTSLMRVNCYQNKLKGKEMTNFMNSLYQATNEPYLFVIDTKADGVSEGNIATTTDVKIATDKDWEVFDYANGANWGMGVPYEGSEPTEPELPEQYFTLTRSSKGHIMFNISFADNDYTPIIEGGTLSGWNGSGLTINMTDETVKVYGDAVSVQALFAMIENIDVTNLPNLTELNVALNDITEIDLTHCPKLSTFSCEGNLITSLDFSNCPVIDFINCYGNQIKGEEMTQMINSLPTRSSDAAGQLIVYDSSYSSEGNICLKTDVANAREKYWMVYQLTADNPDPVIYEGFDQAGIENVAITAFQIRYDATNCIISIPQTDTIEVYNIAGRLVVKSDDSDHISVATLPSGIYVVRVGNETLKISK